VQNVYKNILIFLILLYKVGKILMKWKEVSFWWR